MLCCVIDMSIRIISELYCYMPLPHSDFLENIIDFGSPVKLVRLIKMCSESNYSVIHIAKHLGDVFPM
jgi:hypothetical protein